MFKHILTAVDGSDCSATALDMAVSLAKAEGAKLTVINVVDIAKAALAGMDPYGGTSIPWLEALTEEGLDLTQKAGAKAAAAGVVVETEVLRGASVVDQIARAAADRGCDLIVIGSHGRSGFSRLALGSVAEGVMRQVAIPALIVHARQNVPAAATAAHG